MTTTQRQPEPGKSDERLRVLVVEDSPVNLQLALLQLQTLGYVTDSALNGREALERRAGQRYDIILMDCQMPEMDGFEATWQIRQQEADRVRAGEEVRPVQIIAMTADAAEDSREKCLAAGMNDYIRKPVQVPELEAVLARARQALAGGEADEVLDPMILAGLRLLRQAGRPDPVAQLIALFLEEAPERLAAINQAVRANDMWSMSKIVAAATSLKGSSSNIGARDLARLCGEIELAGRDGAMDEVGQLAGQAGQELERVRQALARVV
jgi:CheY-like chemotaxis protein